MKKFILTIALFAMLGLANSSDDFPFDITEIDTSQNPEGWAEFFTELEKVMNEFNIAGEEQEAEEVKEEEVEEEKEEAIESEEKFDTDEDDEVLREKEMKAEDEEEDSTESNEKSEEEKEDETKQEDKKPLNDPIDQNNDKDEEKLLAEELCLRHICPRMYVPICASIDGEKRSHPSPCEFRNEVNCKSIINERMGKALPTVKVHYGGSCKN